MACATLRYAAAGARVVQPRRTLHCHTTSIGLLHRAQLHADRPPPRATHCTAHPVTRAQLRVAWSVCMMLPVGACSENDGRDELVLHRRTWFMPRRGRAAHVCFARCVDIMSARRTLVVPLVGWSSGTPPPPLPPATTQSLLPPFPRRSRHRVARRGPRRAHRAPFRPPTACSQPRMRSAA